MRAYHVAAGLAAVLALSGCQRTSVGAFDQRDMGGPAPLQAQPVPSVSGGSLPPPTSGDTSQFPAAPVNQTAALGGAQVPPGAPAVPAASLDVTKESMVGNWRVANGGSSCDMFLTLTNLGSGSRGGTRGCAGELTQMGSWEVAGKQVVLKDRSGNALARLYKTADSRYDGQTNGGQPVSLSR
ncbi:protease inhibitor Inh/omp19 family protein [Rhizobium sp. NFR03]|uniref:protease inhibitor Inh/omp19 family protein n=1 Tax=Rhizobium sp. NFR03 TaxID=1566263 RepID=UPI0008D6AA4F|nr:protease inhibitor Inh/omp19 family protein [Rhizobium sp. NFR03]SES36783.1 Protease inhibitor Inh [Rhizobium sp. NFR03]